MYSTYTVEIAFTSSSLLGTFSLMDPFFICTHLFVAIDMTWSPGQLAKKDEMFCFRSRFVSVRFFFFSEAFHDDTLSVLNELRQSKKGTNGQANKQTFKKGNKYIIKQSNTD